MKVKVILKKSELEEIADILKLFKDVDSIEISEKEIRIITKERNNVKK